MSPQKARLEMPERRLFKVTAAATYLGVHRDTVYTYISKGLLPVVNIALKGSDSRIDVRDLDAFIAARKRTVA